MTTFSTEHESGFNVDGAKNLRRVKRRSSVKEVKRVE